MKNRILVPMLFLFFCFACSACPAVRAEARVTAEEKKEYINALSEAIQDGVASQNMDLYAKIAKMTAGKNALKKAIMQNRAALMAEGIDYLDDSSWSHYYTVKKSGGHTVFSSTKTISRKKFARRYQKIMDGVKEVLSCIDSSMTDADKAMAVYYYLAINTTYKDSSDSHTGYDVLVKHTGVCDGFANAYALIMNTLGIECTVVTSYSQDHSWNMVKLDDVWYLCDLTDGIGSGSHKGMVVSYSSCLVSTSTFLTAHSGYTMNDIYGDGNSSGLSIQSLTLASSDYIPARSAIRAGISEKTCMFYHNGYWYWISTGNMLKRSKLNGTSTQTIYKPSDSNHIGWISEFGQTVYISINDTIYKINYSGKTLTKVRKVLSSEYTYKASSYFWQVAYVGRFYEKFDGSIGYYVTDLDSSKKGSGKISAAKSTSSASTLTLSDTTVTLRAGYHEQLYVYNISPSISDPVQWKSSRTRVATVDENGYVTAKKKGTAVITAYIGNVKVKCKIKVTGYTITYNNAGINSSENVATATGKKKIVLKSPTRSGYVFQGWYSDKNYTTRVRSIKKGNTKNITLYAKWKKK
ncbi:MAG: InlB B-repeat-containing protein, partial [Clostridiales bacterium]|nr:InlB B-repeat-containing protein [Clostridiales bacterium]